MSSRRIERLNEQLKREITELLRRRLRDPRVVDVSVTAVEVTNDLWLARVYVSLPPDATLRTQALAGLEAATPFIRRELGAALHIRRMPELRFLEDRTQEAAQRIEDLLRETRPSQGPSDEGEQGET